jgi:ribosomal protein S18 acetylase RimI-like enzyme
MDNTPNPNFIINYRPAIKADARRIAELYSVAADGISDYIWSKLAEPGQSIMDIGQQRFERKNTAFSFENSIVAQIENDIAAGLLAFEMQEDADYVEEDPVLKPYWLLEEANSLYIAGITVDDRWRKLGIAKTLMLMAEDKCRQLSLSKLSLIVFEENTIAHDLYLRLGYKEVMRKAIVPHSMVHCEGDALLMVKHL